MFLFGCSAALNAASEAPTLVALELPGLTDAERKGAFSGLYNILQDKKLIAGWEPAPIFRAHQKFLNREASCIAPSSKLLLDEYEIDRSEVAPLVPFNRVKGYLMTAPNYILEPNERPSLGVVGIGHLFGVEQDAYKIVNVTTYDQLLNLIGANRVSAAYVNYPDVIHHSTAMEIINSFEGQVELRWDGVDNIMCWKEFRSAQADINSTVDELQRSGALKELFGKYYIGLDTVD
ncbi:MAG: hypothetical protein AB3N28_12005 [Kordiimonas sp.]